MSRKLWAWIRRALCAPLALALTCGAVYADPGCGASCQHWHCPPPYHHCQEGPPCIKFKCGCPKPVCPPCTLEHYGYYETCWRPWAFPPDWTHCPVPPPSAHLEMPGGMVPLPAQPGTMPGAGQGNGNVNPEQVLPTPRCR